MDLKHEMRSFIATGGILSLVSAIPLVFAVGIGGALVSAVMGIVVSAIVGVVRNRVAQNAQHAMEGHTQIQGVLDSSQLEDSTPSAEDMIPFAKHSRVIAVVVSLAATLITGGIVAAVTNGVGINFYLGEGPSLATNSDKDTKKTTSSKTSSNNNDQGLSGQETTSDEGTTETWYPSPEQQEQTQQQSTPQESTQSGANHQTDSTNTNEQPTQPATPTDSGSTNPTPSEPSSAEQPSSNQVPSQQNNGDANSAQTTQE